MGQCGCADGFGDFKFRGEGGWYAIQLYAGCEDCDSPAGVQVFFYPDNGNITDCIENVPDTTLKMKELAEDGRGLFLPILSFHDLESEPSLVQMGSPKAYRTVKDLVSDMQYAVRQAAVTTINRTLQGTHV